MKRFISIFIIVSLLLLTFSACDSGEGVPFITTKSPTTAPVNTVMVTFPEGFTVHDIAHRLEEKGVCSAEEFIIACKTPYDGIQIDNPDERVILLEGYIFPDTYEFYLNSEPQAVIKRFIDNYNEMINDEIKAQIKKTGYTVDEILTLASIIQKECDEDIAECANVSSVFNNRLKDPSFPYLQSDPTSYYIKDNLGEYLGYNKGLPIEEQNEDVQKYYNLYNTYYCTGLPAGPICNPGMKAIRAALNPADTDYVYFLTDASCKNFYYASTLEQHQENGRKAGIF